MASIFQEDVTYITVQDLKDSSKDTSLLALDDESLAFFIRKAEIVIDKPTKTFVGVLAEDQDKVKYASDVIGYGGKLKLTDVEDDDEVWDLDLPKMLKGIAMYCQKNNIAPSDLMDNYDADTADGIVQYALFDEITFG